MPFHPLLLDRLSQFKTIRFMNWIQQEGQIKWSDRITPLTYTQGQGVAYEYMIQLCNILKTNAWIIVPYQANDEYVFQMATLFKNTLRKDVTIDLE